jgi:hypothetical protein
MRINLKTHLAANERKFSQMGSWLGTTDGRTWTATRQKMLRA